MPQHKPFKKSFLSEVAWVMPTQVAKPYGSRTMRSGLQSCSAGTNRGQTSLLPYGQVAKWELHSLLPGLRKGHL